MYASHFLLYTGFVLWSFSFWNLAVLLAFYAITPWRIAKEERHLSQDGNLPHLRHASPLAHNAGSVLECR